MAVKIYTNKEILEELNHELLEYWKSLPIKYKSEADIKRANQLMTDELRRFNRARAYDENHQRLEKAAHNLKHLVEHELRELAAGETEEHKKEHEDAHGKKRRMMGKVPSAEERADITNKGTITVQTQDNSTVKEKNPTIVRGGFGGTGKAAAAGQTVKPVDQAVLTQEQKAAQQARIAADLERRQATRPGVKGRMISRGGDSGRARAHETRPVRKIQAGQGPNRKGTVTRPPNRPPGTPLKKPQPAKTPYAQAGIPTPTKKPVVDPSTKTVIPSPKIIPLIIPGEYETEEAPEYDDSGGRGVETDDRRAAPGNNRDTNALAAPPVVPGIAPAPSRPAQQPGNDDDGGGGGGHRHPRKRKKNPLGSKAAKGLGRGAGTLARAGGQLIIRGLVMIGPWGWAIVAIILAIIIIIAVVMAIIDGSGGQCQSGAGTPGGTTAKGEPSTNELMNIYGHTQQEVEANLVDINFQGKTVKVHKLVSATFEKVNQEITAANTGYVFRQVGTYAWRQKNCPGGCSGLSTHSFGITMDVNPDTNPYTRANQHDIPPVIVDIFKRNGFGWGGDWSPNHDWMHFQFEGTPGTYTPGNPAGGVGGTTGGGGAAFSCGGGGATAEGYVAPAPPDSCGGKYSTAVGKTPLKLNFGDPACSFDKDKLHQQLQLADPVNADVWFNKIIPCESGYQPNAYAGPQTGTPDANGAWGLYQMGSSTPAGQAPPAPGKNGENDRGDVNWEVQTTNAVATGKRIGTLGKYWACAR